jgi:undecaprenyl phosphate-alpha-L-ara4FN deformylase
VAGKGEVWTRREFEQAVARFREVFDAEPKTFGAAGWQINAATLALQEETGMDYASDTRGGLEPYLPSMGGRIYKVPQIPGTLPTLDELVGVDGITVDNVTEHLLKLTAAEPPATGHVFTLHAELEGMALRPIFEKLLAGWKAQGYELVATRDLARGLDRSRLPVYEVVMGEIPGRSGTLAVQRRKLAAHTV